MEVREIVISLLAGSIMIIVFYGILLLQGDVYRERKEKIKKLQ